MAVMQSGDNWIWLLAEGALVVLSLLLVWYLTIMGRDRQPSKQKRGEHSIERYGDGLEEDHSPLPKFLIWTYSLVGIWIVSYAVWTGLHGLI